MFIDFKTHLSLVTFTSRSLAELCRTFWAIFETFGGSLSLFSYKLINLLKQIV